MGNSNASVIYSEFHNYTITLQVYLLQYMYNKKNNLVS